MHKTRWDTLRNTDRDDPEGNEGPRRHHRVAQRRLDSRADHDQSVLRRRQDVLELRMWTMLRASASATSSIDQMHRRCRQADRADPVPRWPSEPAAARHVRVGETPVEKLQLALDSRPRRSPASNGGVAGSVELSDNGTRQLLEEILVGGESHAKSLESQLKLVPKSAGRCPLPRPADPRLTGGARPQIDARAAADGTFGGRITVDGKGFPGLSCSSAVGVAGAGCRTRTPRTVHRSPAATAPAL